jgi:hypothetical protein
MNSESGIIERVDRCKGGFDIGFNSGGFVMSSKYKVIPKVGDSICVYTHRGCTVRGVDLNGKTVYYKTDQQLEDDHKKWCEKYEREKQKKFKKNQKAMDKMYDELPPEFQQRIDTFRKNNPKFRTDYEHYELFCCQQAVLIANTLKTPEKVREWSESDNKWVLVPDLDKGHSGNTLDMATHLAYWYLQQPEAIARIHGSLSALVGSREYEEKNKRKKLSKNEK